MAEDDDGWFVEEGIGEHRAVRIERGRMAAARVEWPGRVAAGDVVEAKLTARGKGSVRGTAVTSSAEEVLVDRLPPGASEGASVRLAIMRAALHGAGRHKRAAGRPSDAPLAQASLADRLEAKRVRRFPVEGWNELVDEALVGETHFAGGTLLFAPTPAMTTVDIDGGLPPRALALAAVPAVADAMRRFDLGGSVVIDFPTLADKSDRRTIDDSLGAALSDWPHERTAMNGFGLVQIVARLERPSLLHLAAWQRRELVWRRLLRRAEGLEGAGIIELSVHPSLEPAIEPDHLAALERRTGRRVKVRKVATLVPDAPHAQCVAPQ